MKNDPLADVLKTSDFAVAGLGLTNECLEGNMHVDLCEGIADIDPLIGNCAPTFFVQTFLAHLYAAQMYAFKLFDTHRKAFTIPRFLQMCCMRRAKFKHEADVMDAITESGETIRTLRPFIKILTSRRHFYLAHIDPVLIFNRESLVKSAPLKYEEIRKVLTEGGRIVNNLTWLWNETTNQIKNSRTDDYKRAINLICEQMCAHADKRDEEARRVGWNIPSPRPKPCT